jgi:hypothetical protein
MKNKSIKICISLLFLTVSCGKQQDDNLEKQFKDQSAEGDKIYYQKLEIQEDFQTKNTAINYKLLEFFTCDPKYKKGEEILAEFDELEKITLERATAISKAYAYEFQKKTYQARSDLKYSISIKYNTSCAYKN